MPIEIEQTNFVSPVKAFQIVGRESFGPDWRPECIDDHDSDLRRIALSNLRAALESGHVCAFWHEFDFERPLTPIEVAGEFFRINLEDDCIHLSVSAGVPIRCRIHGIELAAFIKGAGKVPAKLTASSEHRCKVWLISLMSGDGPVPQREALWNEARGKFSGLSVAGFRRARAEAIDETGRTDLKKAGRPARRKI